MSIIEYVWIGGNNELRSKTKILYEEIKTIDDIPNWNFDGSSTGQASGNDSEVIIVPRALFYDPFRERRWDGTPHRMVLCDTYTPNNEPIETNNRHWASNIFSQRPEEEPWFGLEQEYFLIDPKNMKPLGYEENKEQGQFYCSVGSENAFGRLIAEKHLEYCILAGIKISGINAEVAPGQWEFQIGPCLGIQQGDYLWMARYILKRVAEMYDTFVSFEAKPLSGNWNGSGCHTNYSTKKMREGFDGKEGIVFIHEAIDKLSKKHMEHMEHYGSGNKDRMTGEYETASYDTFSYGIANRGASIRIGNENHKNKKGYFEDRRPSSNCDPYLVTAMMFQTTCLNNEL